MQVPCKDCLILPICKHKHFIDLGRECSFVNSYLYDEDGNKPKDFNERLEKLFETLDPTYWITGKTKDDLPFLKYKQRSKKFKGTYVTRITLVGNAR